MEGREVDDGPFADPKGLSVGEGTGPTGVSVRRVEDAFRAEGGCLFCGRLAALTARLCLAAERGERPDS